MTYTTKCNRRGNGIPTNFTPRALLYSVVVGVAVLGLILDCGCSRSPEGDSWSRTPSPEPRFGDRQSMGLLAHDPIDEASGLAASRQNPGVLWTHNDSGGGPRLYALGADGHHLGAYVILGARSEDWEDIAVGPGPDEKRHYIYIGEIGDNKARYETRVIYRLPEPLVDPRQAPIESALAGAEAIRFRYPAGPRDAEALFVDPLTRDIYIVSKREPKVGVFRLAWPQATEGISEAEHLGDLPLTKVNAGDISPSGREILLKTYDRVLHWTRQDDESIWQALQAECKVLPYWSEPQGEAVAWSADENGYFTLSEEKKKIPAFLYFYPRLEPESEPAETE